MLFAFQSFGEVNNEVSAEDVFAHIARQRPGNHLYARATTINRHLDGAYLQRKRKGRHCAYSNHGVPKSDSEMSRLDVGTVCFSCCVGV